MSERPKLPQRFKLIDGLLYVTETALLVLMIAGIAAIILWIIREAL